MMIRTCGWTYPAPKNPDHHARQLLSEWTHITQVQLLNEGGLLVKTYGALSPSDEIMEMLK